MVCYSRINHVLCEYLVENVPTKRAAIRRWAVRPVCAPAKNEAATGMIRRQTGG